MTVCRDCINFIDRPDIKWHLVFPFLPPLQSFAAAWTWSRSFHGVSSDLMSACYLACRRSLHLHSSHGLINAMIYTKQWSPDNKKMYSKSLKLVQPIKMKSHPHGGCHKSGFDLSVESSYRWCCALWCRAAVSPIQDDLESDERRSNPIPAQALDKLFLEPLLVFTTLSDWTLELKLTSALLLRLSTNSATDAKWCKPKQSAECG